MDMRKSCMRWQCDNRTRIVRVFGIHYRPCFVKATEGQYTYDPRYRSFNTRKEKLFTNRSRDFANRRCIIPASCFYEWKGYRYKIQAVDQAIAFGGLYKTWPIMDPKDPHYSCSIITLPPHARFSHIHDKSFPLMLLNHEINDWLNPSNQDIGYWHKTLETRIRFDLKVTPVDKKHPNIEIGPCEIILAD